MTTFTLIIVGGVGFAVGLYVSSQIMEHIDCRTRNKKFMRNLESFDKKRK